MVIWKYTMDNILPGVHKDTSSATLPTHKQLTMRSAMSTLNAFCLQIELLQFKINLRF